MQRNQSPFLASTVIYSLTSLSLRRESSKRRKTMIKRVKGGYKVLSETTKKNLGGPYKTKAEAEKRLRQVEFFKHNKAS
jgi:hypothetical protein